MGGRGTPGPSGNALRPPPGTGQSLFDPILKFLLWPGAARRNFILGHETAVTRIFVRSARAQDQPAPGRLREVGFLSNLQPVTHLAYPVQCAPPALLKTEESTKS